MFITHVGRRLVVIVLSLSILVVLSVLAVAIYASTNALSDVTQSSFAQQHTNLQRTIENELRDIEASMDALAADVRVRTRWTSGELRAYVIDELGTSALGNPITAVSLYRPDALNQIFIYDYTLPDDMPAGMILPVNRSASNDSVPRDSWLNEALRWREPAWFGPQPSTISETGAAVLVYAIPIRAENANPSASDGVLWAEIPLNTLDEAIESTLMLYQDNADGDYTLVLNEDDVVITSRYTREGSAIPGERLRLMQVLPEPSQPVLMTDPLDPTGRSRAFVMIDELAGTPWRLVDVIPNRLLSRALPFDTIASLVLITVFGLLFLAIVVQRFIQRAVTQPLERLSLAAQEIGAGDLRYQISYRDRHDEIGRLARALEDMKTNLSQSYQELENWSITLEQRVKSRTRELDVARREAQATANEMRAVYDESLLVVSAYQLQTILNTLSQRIYTLLEGSYVGVWLVTDDGEHLRLVANTMTDKHQIGTLIPIDQGLVGNAVTRGELLVVDDYPTWIGRLDFITSEQMHQAMAVPLMFSGTAIGAVIVGRTYDSPFFEADDQRLLRLFANLVSPAIRNAQLLVQRDDAVRDAERANQVKTRFLASVTHELRTPLNLVINNMDFMRIGAFGPVTDEQTERLDQTTRSAEHLLYLINDLLDVSKIEAGEMQLFMQENDLYAIIEDVIADTEILIEKYDKLETVALHQELDDSVPPFPMDARRIRQVLVNLLSNAVKFTDRGSVTLRVKNHRHYVRIDVIDTGMGVSDEEISKLFEAFERTSSAKAKAIEGTGLGLPISRYLVEAHGGEMVVRSVVGEGSTFSFTLPLTKRARRKLSDSQQMQLILNRSQDDGSTTL